MLRAVGGMGVLWHKLKCRDGGEQVWSIPKSFFVPLMTGLASSTSWLGWASPKLTVSEISIRPVVLASAFRSVDFVS